MLVRGLAKGPSRACSLVPRVPVSRKVPAQDPSRHWWNSTWRRSWLSWSLGRVPSGSIRSITWAARMRRSLTAWVSANPTSNRSPSSMSAGSKPRRSTCAKARSMIDTCSGLTRPACCAAAKCGRSGGRGWPSMLVRSPTAAAARTRRDASPGDSRSTLINTRIIDGCVSASGRSRDSAFADQRMVVERDPVPRLLQSCIAAINCALSNRSSSDRRAFYSDDRHPQRTDPRRYRVWSRSRYHPRGSCSHSNRICVRYLHFCANFLRYFPTRPSQKMSRIPRLGAQVCPPRTGAPNAD